MSIIYKDNKGRIYISSKGADSILLERMNKNKLKINDKKK